MLVALNRQALRKRHVKISSWSDLVALLVLRALAGDPSDGGHPFARLCWSGH